MEERAGVRRVNNVFSFVSVCRAPSHDTHLEHKAAHSSLCLSLSVYQLVKASNKEHLHDMFRAGENDSAATICSKAVCVSLEHRHAHTRHRSRTHVLGDARYACFHIIPYFPFIPDKQRERSGNIPPCFGKFFIPGVSIQE